MVTSTEAGWDRDRVNRTIREDRIIAVIRTPTEDSGRRLIEAAAEGGIRLVEVTLTTPGALRLIRDHSAIKEICVGAGTVMDAEQAGQVIDAGGRFVISPHTDPATITACGERSVTVIPGTLTPSEVARAWALRPDFVKVFPIAPLGGARYLQVIRGPLPDVPIIPTGGVQREDIADLFRAGAVAVGVSDGLAGSKEIAEGRWAQVTQRARDLVETIRKVG